ncbi:hypothetical protein TELCIR_11202 [Teladorsagia circumcincta]|uniref:Uncharacterized protein n=1 Tax=Teladorsagia circumcincta TaxID=45464 RepID=A0A2G9UBD9_TELCI|nr:hypothetical protein TELCIR_11202 [Teladorsagia circumcincta]
MEVEYVAFVMRFRSVMSRAYPVPDCRVAMRQRANGESRCIFPTRPSFHYPTVCVQIPPRASASSVSTPPGVVSYAVPYAKPIQYSASQLQYENMKHRCKMLDSENQRLMRLQHELVIDANRRVEMHVNEIRMLKEDNKKLTGANKEISVYQQRLHEMEGRQTELLNENEELKQLCLYLDEQRQRSFVYRTEDDRESEDLGEEEKKIGYDRNDDGTIAQIHTF